MPTFRFRCLDCYNEFDFLILPGIEEKIICPECKSENIEKLITGFNPAGKSNFSKESCCGLSSPCDNPKRCCEQ